MEYNINKLKLIPCTKLSKKEEEGIVSGKILQCQIETTNMAIDMYNDLLEKYFNLLETLRKVNDDLKKANDLLKKLLPEEEKKEDQGIYPWKEEEEGLTEYGYKKGGIEYATEDEANEN